MQNSVASGAAACVKWYVYISNGSFNFNSTKGWISMVGFIVYQSDSLDQVNLSSLFIYLQT